MTLALRLRVAGFAAVFVSGCGSANVIDADRSPQRFRQFPHQVATPPAVAQSTPQPGTPLLTTPTPTPAPTATPTPAPTAAPVSIAGAWPAYNGPFQKPIPPNPAVLANSAAIITNEFVQGCGSPTCGIGAGFISTGPPNEPWDYGHPVYFAKNTDPLYTIACDHDPATYHCTSIEGDRIRVPAYAKPAGGTDGHLAVVTPDGQTEYDFWAAQPLPGTGGTLHASSGRKYVIGGPGVAPQGWTQDQGCAVNLCSAISQGLVRAEEINAGAINHAIFMISACTNGGGVPPAPQPGGDGFCAGPDTMPRGSRVWLAMSDAEIDALAAPPYQTVLMKALAHYGAFNGDAGGVGLGFQSPDGMGSYVAGKVDPWVTIANTYGFATVPDGRRIFEWMPASVDLIQRLKVLQPTCQNQGTC